MPTEVSIQFSPSSLTILNVCLAVIMFGVALDIQWKHFTELLNQKKAVVTGLVSQLLLLPAITSILILVLPISTGMAMGMLLVACCPGGNVSNFYAHMARGNVALSVTLTAWSSLSAFLITPISFFLWSSLLPALSLEVKSFEVDFFSLMINMVCILLLPLIAGMAVNKFLPDVSKKISSPIRLISMLMLTGFIVGAVLNNQEGFAVYLGEVFWIVLLHNGLVLVLAFYFSKLLKNDEAVNRTIAIETGIQNSGLGLILIFNFFDGNTAMAMVAAWWGVWHLISGFIFAYLVRKRVPVLP
ncbi:MAG: bile acid:sodium symporter family protein [Cyclobacteriaceae bacterium]|nr:bile acid:sodium symporter family protein [Cyclobacteriaceae bacterium]